MVASHKKPSKISRPVKRLQTKKEIEWIELPVFIHGMTPSKYPGTGDKEYRQLLGRVNNALKLSNKGGFPKESIFITWGRPTPQSEQSDQYLAEVERKIDSRVKKSMGNAYAGPFGLYGVARDILFFGISDVSYYLSADGEQALRSHIFNYIGQEISKLDKSADHYFSLTIFGHSAGSIIAHDMLYHLFNNKNYTRSQEVNTFTEMEKLRQMIDNRRLRIRHLYTFGSPISTVMLRSDSLIHKFRANKLIQPEDIGLGEEKNLSNPRWVNFWSRYDLASYPVSFFYSNPTGVIKDVEIRSNLSPEKAHLGYWTSNEMADHIAKTF